MLKFRFQTKLTIVYLVLFLVVMGVIALFFYRSVTNNVREQIEGQLSASARTFERILDDRVEKLSASALLLSRDYGFRDAINNPDDQATAMSALRNHRARLGADLAYILDLDDELVASTGAGDSLPASTPIPDDMKIEAEENGSAARMVEIDGRIYELVVVPVLAPIPTAWIAFGMELNEATAREIKSLSPIDLEIAFVYDGGNGDYALAGATSERAALADFLRTHPLAAGAFSADFSGQDHLFWHLPLHASEGDAGIGALLYYSIDVALEPYDPLVVAMGFTLIGGLVLLIAGSVVVSRGVTRPLRRLADAAQRITAGEYLQVASPTEGDEVADLTVSFNQMVDAVQERETKIKFQAFHDTETGFPNRLMFEELLDQTIENSKSFVIVVAEVQQIPELRTVLNHRNVNDLMVCVGERLRQVVSTDVARLTTESFAFILRDSDEAEIVASLAMNSFLTPFDVAGIVIDARAKLGLAKFPGDGDDTAVLLRHAYAALDKGRSAPKGFAWYDPDTDKSQTQRLSMMSELRVGLKNGEVRFAYQPKLDLATGKITAAEALVRWISPTRGFVPPDDFIPLAERTGDVRHLTEWGLRAAIKQIADWQKKGLNLAVAVNLSTSDLMNGALPSQILALLKEFSVPAGLLKLEVTESAVMHDMERALDVLNMLAAMGLTLSIDDYGTGYSSLSYIKKLPVSEIKIDKSFVMNLAKSEEDNILVRSTIELGHNLGLAVTAEGVEDEESVARLKAYGCDTLQGYHISRPVPAQELEKFLEEGGYETN
ncbi:putative bifunctional diguanylate cyclase/phosphodiesterase [Kordiimonas gwangyangensis]|uniref:putative bifunctional diguanylate cyclase/phosphodiesterase n=1 Tax=Kordiimonas gwangyangensis TaxID=288022 RepID=UPI000363447C|nr:EAL domain-containing protein [Kordiimonas gwangyangensis]